MFVHLFMIILGFFLLIYGADLLVKGASGIAKKFHISEIVIGLTIVSLGTSLPELMITLVSSSEQTHELVIGNVIGSNLCNLLLILGVLLIIKPFQFKDSTRKVHLPLLLFLNISILIMAVTSFSKPSFMITFKEGLFLLVIAFIYLAIPFVQHLKNNTTSLENVSNSDVSQDTLLKSIILILLGGFALKYGGDFVVDYSIHLAHLYNISETMIGLTVVALGTSLPELITSIVAVAKGNKHIAEGNIFGSCIINFSLILGFGATISNLILDKSAIENLILLLGSTMLIWMSSFYYKNHPLKRAHGLILLLIFGVYILHLFII